MENIGQGFILKNNAKQLSLLQGLLTLSELDNGLLNNVDDWLRSHDIAPSQEILNILNNPVLFDCDLPLGYEIFWIDGNITDIPVVYRADPSLTAFFAFGVLAGKAAAAGAVGAAGAAGAYAVRKALKDSGCVY